VRADKRAEEIKLHNQAAEHFAEEVDISKNKLSQLQKLQLHSLKLAK
jgi:hypothetical protein